MILPLGSIVNALSVIIGSIIGIYFGSFLSEKIRKAVFQIIGLFTLALGMQMSLKTNQFLILLVSLITGTIIGEILSIEKGIESLSNKLKIKLQSENKLFSEGLITAFLLYCVGSMTFVGSIEEGIHQDRTLMYTKSLMDGITSILLASSFGTGVLFSAIPLLIFQSALTLGAHYFESYLHPELITEISAVGGVIIIGIGLNILEITKIKVSNMLPALLLIIPIYHLIYLVQIY
ncbi:MAG: membrane protein [Cryomorphaceae bacterium]|nr:MAG: membrane protein [Cryomorphaceae bacterium]